MKTRDNDKDPPRPGEADTPAEAHDEVAPEVRRLRHGDDVPQRGDPAEGDGGEPRGG